MTMVMVMVMEGMLEFVVGACKKQNVIRVQLLLFLCSEKTHGDATRYLRAFFGHTGCELVGACISRGKSESRARTLAERGSVRAA